MTSIQVAVRIRPLKTGEVGTNNMEVVADSRRVIFGPKAFDCDLLLDPETTQEKLFQSSCMSIVDNVMEGQRGTILVYGQTGTGKTHTMFGPTGCPDGVVFSAIQHILSGQRNRELTISLSVLEVYMEKVTDLFTLKEVPVFCGQPRNVQWKPVTNVGEASQVIFDALDGRHTAATAMNERSSRSHVIVNVKVLRASSTEVDSEGNAKIDASNLLLVDLAGSESLGKSKATGKTAHEASSINKSLLALKQIILALSGGQSGSTPSHIPYRDSKLTELLQDSIGGCSRTVMIACVSPSARDLEETKSTLEYATKARQIKNLAQTDRERMAIKIKSLEFELQKARNRLEQQGQERGVVVVTKTEYDELQQMSTRVEELRVELQRQYEEKDKAENYRHFHASVQKQLRDEIELLQGKLDDAMTHREDITASVQESLGKMRSELRVAAQTYEQALEQRAQCLGDVLHGVEIPASVVENFQKATQEMSAYVNRSVEELVAYATSSMVRTVQELRALVEQESQEQAHMDELASLVDKLSHVMEEQRATHAARNARARDALTELDITTQQLRQRNVDFVAVDALQTSFVNETEAYRSSVMDKFNAVLQQTPTPLAGLDDILLRGERDALRAALAPRKRTREAKSDADPANPKSAGNVPGPAPAMVDSTAISARSHIPSNLTTASSLRLPTSREGSMRLPTTSRSQTPGSSNAMVNAKRKKALFTNTTNLTS